MPEPQVTITPRGVQRLDDGHLWVYRSDIQEAAAQPGDIVCVTDERRRYVGRAFYSDRSQITLRFLTRQDVPIRREFLAERIRAAVAHRQVVVQDAQAFRLLYGEGDLLPSIIVDRYADYLVIQTLSQGAERLKELLVQILKDELAPQGILERNDARLRLREGLEQRVSVLFGQVPERVSACVNAVQFRFDLYKGQKTGAFLDQRENQRVAVTYARGQTGDQQSQKLEWIRQAPSTYIAQRKALGGLSHQLFVRVCRSLAELTAGGPDGATGPRSEGPSAWDRIPGPFGEKL